MNIDKPDQAVKYTDKDLLNLAHRFEVYADDQIAFKRMFKTVRERKECDLRADVYQSVSDEIRSLVQSCPTPPL